MITGLGLVFLHGEFMRIIGVTFVTDKGVFDIHRGKSTVYFCRNQTRMLSCEATLKSQTHIDFAKQIWPFIYGSEPEKDVNFSELVRIISQLSL